MTPTKNKQPRIPRNHRTTLILIIIFSTILFLLIWTSLSEAGYISNLLSKDQPQSPPTHNSENKSQLPSLPDPEITAHKPVIYLYPTEKTDAIVNLNYYGNIIASYPPLDKTNSWHVTAQPNGTIIDQTDNQKYSYLFWEGNSNIPVDWNLTSGFVVEGNKTREFLQTTLSKIGLTPEEYNEFIVYWYPKIQNNKYNLIHFAEKQYTQTASLTIDPKPDSLLRVFMVCQPLENKINITPQEIKPFQRTGFTVIEWGGTIVNHQ